MSDVLEFAGVSVVRGQTTLLDDVTWEVEEGERWVILGPNGAGKTTLLQLASGRIHPTRGVAGILGEVLGAVDVFELRPRIGLACAALAERIPARRDRRTTSSSPRPTASSAAGARATTTFDHARAVRAARGARRRPPGRPHLRHAQPRASASASRSPAP